MEKKRFSNNLGTIWFGFVTCSSFILSATKLEIATRKTTFVIYSEHVKRKLIISLVT